MTEKLMFPKLFEPACIGKVKLRNRLVMLPMGTAYASQLGEVTKKTIDYYAQRARGGVGLITVGNVSPYLPNAINQLTLDSDLILMGQYELVEKMHALGAKMCIQINAPGRQKFAAAMRPGEVLVSSSSLAGNCLGQPMPTPKELSRDEIAEWIGRYVAAAMRAKQVGYDMIELHGAHGYLINQFFSPFMNKRMDEFGGSLENRMRFVQELIKALRQAVGFNFPIGFRISADELVPGGITLEESPTVARMLEAAGVDYISVSVGIYETIHKTIDVMRYPETWKEPFWEAIKKAVKVPTIAGGNLKHPDVCERLLIEGKADFIGLARPLFSDDEWPQKAKQGRVEDIRLCISCNECVIGSGRRRRGGGARRCAVNPAAGREEEFAQVKPAAPPKRVMVIGGGPAGMEAARTAAMRGHHVSLYEKDKALGGALLIAGKPQSKRNLLWLRDYLVKQLDNLQVRIELGVKVTPQMVKKISPDAIVLATGAEPSIPDIPGINSNIVVNARDVLLEKVRLEKRRVVVVGGGMIGCEVAEYLLESKNSVTIIEQLPSIASDMESYNRYQLMEVLAECNVSILTKRKVIGISERGVQVTNLIGGQQELIGADLIVIAVGAKPVNTLAKALEGKVPELYIIGDCVEPRVIMEAIYEGSLAGRQV